MSLNVELLLKVKQHILEEPRRLRMNNWLIKNQPGVSILGGEGFGEPNVVTLPSCGTVGCIAGWAIMLGDPAYLDDIKISDGIYQFSAASKACELLQIDSTQEGLDLFCPSEWDNKDSQAYYNAKTQEERARIVAKVIDDFIAINTLVGE